MEIKLINCKREWLACEDSFVTANKIYATHFKGLIGVGKSVEEAIANNPIWKKHRTN